MLAALWLILVACAPSEDAPTALAIAPPPASLQISSVLAGTPTVISGHGLNPGDRVRFFASATGPGAGPCGVAGTPCLGIVNPVDLGAVNANAQGFAHDAGVGAPVFLPASLSSAARDQQHGGADGGAQTHLQQGDQPHGQLLGAAIELAVVAKMRAKAQRQHAGPGS